jgi:hypothetical protein
MEQLNKIKEDNLKIADKFVTREMTKSPTEADKEIKQYKDKLNAAEAALSKIRKRKEDAEIEAKKYSNLLRRELGPLNVDQVNCFNRSSRTPPIGRVEMK